MLHKPIHAQTLKRLGIPLLALVLVGLGVLFSVDLNPRPDRPAPAPGVQHLKPPLELSPSPSPAPTEPVAGRLHGHVICAEDPSAIVGAVVEAKVESDPSRVVAIVRTDGRGRFRMDIKAPYLVAEVDSALLLTALSADGRMRSPARRAPCADLSRDPWIPLPLFATASVKLIVVGPSGEPVPGARICVQTQGERALAGPLYKRSTTVLVSADERGRKELRLAPGPAVAWAARANEPFGTAVEFDIPPAGGVREIQAPVAVSVTHLTLWIRDERDRPVAEAVLRLGGRHGVQRWAADPPGDSLRHFVTDASGRIRIPLETGAVPVLAVVASRGYLPRTIALDRIRAGEWEHRLVLQAVPELVIRVGQEGGAPLPPEIPVAFLVVPPDEQRGWPSSVLSPRSLDGRLVEPLPPADSVHPLEVLHPWLRGDPMKGPDENGAYRTACYVPGVYRVAAHLPGGVRVEKKVAISAEDREVETVLLFPAGRVVRLVWQPAAEAPPGYRRARRAERSQLKVWSAWPGVVPDDWPVTRAEHLQAHGTDTQLFMRVGSSTALTSLWLPAGHTELLVRPFHVVGFLARAREASFATEVYKPWGRLERYRVPEGPLPEVIVREPLVNASEESGELLVRLLAGGSPLAEAGIDVVALRQERPVDGSGAPANRATIVATNARGEAVLRLRPGRYEILVRSPPGNGPRRTVLVQGSALVVDLDLFE